MSDRVNFRYYQITDRKAVGAEKQAEILKALIAAGLRGLQIREKDLSQQKLLKFVDALLPNIGDQVSVLVNTDIEVAQARHLGLHRPERGLATAEIRARLGPDPLIGVSCHDLEGAMQAQNTGADFITLSPVFATPGKGPAMGLEMFRKIVSQLSIPVFALGGITAANTRSCIESGAYGIAAIRATLTAQNPVQAFLEILEEIGES
ncbi:MAG: thiamine phosphate synthase [Candidatus Eisenbacteria bacterium]|uniref:Thiamine phosphate synthase n=1 Tax=Eiseniibacteriota bacterium TaxID=2212470 RepID=A0A948RVW1_UNCEI|nr:thiamine phosphate synthase [Candidatus Eisenbacteria bacterium]MBU1950534.1 thiamine phosphate synthase [Candidatus Eisenbacteria bacterium]MBU2690931.1 thiamine phosphate synthase [Candidatus Eisenbacteria bacterium]